MQPFKKHNPPRKDRMESLCTELVCGHPLDARNICLVPRLRCSAEKLGSQGVLGWMESGFSESAPQLHANRDRIRRSTMAKDRNHLPRYKHLYDSQDCLHASVNSKTDCQKCPRFIC